MGHATLCYASGMVRSRVPSAKVAPGRRPCIRTQRYAGDGPGGRSGARPRTTRIACRCRRQRARPRAPPRATTDNPGPDHPRCTRDRVPASMQRARGSAAPPVGVRRCRPGSASPGRDAQRPLVVAVGCAQEPPAALDQASQLALDPSTQGPLAAPFVEAVARCVRIQQPCKLLPSPLHCCALARHPDFVRGSTRQG